MLCDAFDEPSLRSTSVASCGALKRRYSSASSSSRSSASAQMSAPSARTSAGSSGRSRQGRAASAWRLRARRRTRRRDADSAGAFSSTLRSSGRQLDAGFGGGSIRTCGQFGGARRARPARTSSAARFRRPVATPARGRRARLPPACRTRRRCRGGCGVCRSVASARRCRATPRAAAPPAATRRRCRRRSAADDRRRARVRSRRRPRCRRAPRDSVDPDSADASSIALRVSLVNLQKFTLWACVAPASMRMLAPAQKMPGLPERRITACTSGCSKRSRWIASASSMSTPMS